MFRVALISLLLLALLSQSGSAQTDPAKTIIGIERAALDRSDRGDPGGFLEISDPEVTYFDPALAEPIHGLENLRAYYRKAVADAQAAGFKPFSGEMSHAKVQFAGDAAVLTFNYTSRSPERVIEWNATEVYRRGPKGWRIIHTHWAYRQPKLAQPK
jgi:ketosteroid isomerase-like protein